MTVTAERIHPLAIHPFHAALLAGMLPLFLGALLTDIAYARTFHVQWQNFASWLIVAALVIGAIAMAWALVDLFRHDRRTGRRLLYAVVVVALWLVGFFDALAHAKDAWAMMPWGLVLSAIATVLALVATWLGFSAPRRVGARTEVAP